MLYITQLISVALKERICKDNSLLVVLQSLDVMFDLLGADECPLIFLTTPDLVPLLQETYRNITARVSYQYTCMNTVTHATNHINHWYDPLN